MSQEGSKLLLSLVDSGKKGFAEYLDYQLQEKMFREDERELFDFVREHAMSYSKLPERKTVRKWGKEHSVAIPSTEALSEPHKYYFDRMEHRNLKIGLLSSMKEAEQHRQDDPQIALDVLTSSILELHNTARRKQLVNIAEDGAKIVEAEYVKTLLNENTGLKFGWPTFDKMSGGLVGGDLVSIVGRPGMGKTYMALHGMIHAWHQGMTTLFVSMEMKNTPIIQRVTAMASNTSISELKSAQVASKKYKGMMDVMGSMKGEHGMWVADGALSATVDDIRILCSQLQPDVLFIDGAYLLRHSNTRLQRHDKINTNVELVKSLLADELNIPVTQTFQFNREAASKKSQGDIGLENIAGSDAIGQLSSAVLGLFEQETIETKLKKQIRLLKGRNGEQGEFTINWRFGGFGIKQDHDDYNVNDIMNFTEIEPEEVNTEMKFM